MKNKDDYQISSSVNDDILEIILTGEVKKSSIEKLAIEAATIIIKNGLKNVLVDVHTLKGRLSIMETYSFVRSPSEKPRVRCAVIDLPENAEIMSFFETTAQNAGMSLRCFTNIDAARAWLKSK